MKRAKFKAACTFVVSGRGLVLTGEVVEGLVEIGMSTQIPSWPSRLTISAVEFVRRTDENACDVGLVFENRDEGESARWQDLDLRDQILEIHGSNG